MNVLIVRLGALGDIVHTIPAVAALRDAFPAARIDWLVDVKHREIVDLVEGPNRVIAVRSGTPAGWLEAARQLRQVPYDAALDFQGLLKSAVLARASGARRVIGFSIWHLRERTARPFYSETEANHSTARSGPGAHPDPRGLRGGEEPHIIHKNLGLLRAVGVASERVLFPLARADSPALREIRARLGEAPFALINPGAAWPNKQWPTDRFGEVAVFLREVRGLRSVVLWGPGDETLARAVVDASGGSAELAPPTRVADLVELSRAAALMLSGDTGPLHIAAAAGTPVVALFGPTNPARNGPWLPEDQVLSRYAACGCHYDRRCRQPRWCLADVTVAEVTAAIQQRLAHTVRSRG